MKFPLLLLLFALSFAAFSQSTKKRSITTLAGVAIRNGDGGYHAEIAISRHPKSFGIGSYMSFLSTPGTKFSNWTISGLQMKLSSQARVIRPYAAFDFGVINFQVINDAVNLRTASFDLGGGLEKSIRNELSLLFDVRFKWLVDYRGEWAPTRVATINVGLKF